MDHDEVEELLAAYVLHATERYERLEIKAHLAECPQCGAEVSAHVATAAVLSGQGADAPLGLWGKIVRSIAKAVPPGADGGVGYSPTEQ